MVWMSQAELTVPEITVPTTFTLPVAAFETQASSPPPGTVPENSMRSLEPRAPRIAHDVLALPEARGFVVRHSGLQVPERHSKPLLHVLPAQQGAFEQPQGVPVQVPPEHMSPFVQTLLSLHSPACGVWVQVPSPLHCPTVQTLPLSQE